MKKTIFTIIVFLSFSIGSIYGIEDKVVAVVNNEAITKAELDSYINLIKLQIGYEGWKEFEMSDEKALENLIEDKVVTQEAKKKDIDIPERLIDSRIEDIKRRLGSELEFSEYLSSEGLSLTELKQRLKEKMLSEKLINMQVRSRVFVSPKEVTEYYQEHIDDFVSSESMNLESIFVKVADTANNIYERLRGRDSFAKLQKEYSQRASLGKVSRGQLLKEVEDIIFNLEVGEFSAPVAISDGYYIFLNKEKIPPAKKALIEVQDNIRNLILNKKYSNKLREFIDKLKKDSYIVIKDGQ